ncbi:hypothetical protein [Acinetobacter lwoffii]|uniref:hypothetical protein n=1 Tax=Acinetobacter lwoffii TaxID=28090 RepID=UPI003BF626DB
MRLVTGGGVFLIFYQKIFGIFDCYYAGAKTDEDRHILAMMAKDFEFYMFNSGAFSKRLARVIWEG